MAKLRDSAWFHYKPLRYCYSSHACCVCGNDIMLGQYYYDGGHGKRAHQECVNAMYRKEQATIETGPKS